MGRILISLSKGINDTKIQNKKFLKLPFLDKCINMINIKYNVQFLKLKCYDLHAKTTNKSLKHFHLYFFQILTYSGFKPHIDNRPLVPLVLTSIISELRNPALCCPVRGPCIHQPVHDQQTDHSVRVPLHVLIKPNDKLVLKIDNRCLLLNLNKA